MSTNVDNLTLNKKGTKVVVTGTPKYYNLLATAIQWLPPFVYLAIKFDLFTFENEGFAFTGWGIVGISMLFLILRQKIRDKLKEYEEQFGATWNRAKSGAIALTIATVLFGVYFLSYSFFLIFFIYAGSTFLSLTFYKPYDDLTNKRLAMQKMLDDKTKTADFEKLTKKFDELQR
jgi:hypothetical protein